MDNENKKTLITFIAKAAQVCDNRWAETLKRAKSSNTELNAIGLASGSLQRSLRKPPTLHPPLTAAWSSAGRQPDGTLDHNPDDARWMWWERGGGGLKGRGEGLDVSGVSGQLPETLCVRSALVFLSHPRHAYFKEAVRGGG